MKKLSFYILAIAFVLTSCEDVVDVELNEEDLGLIAVEAYISSRKSNNIYVKIEKSLPVNNDLSNPPVNGAIVKITDDQQPSNSVVLDEEQNSGIYLLPDDASYPGIPNRSYKLSITLPDGVIINSEELLARVENLDSIRINLSARGNYEFLAIFINSKETPGKGNYYKWDIYKNNKLLNEPEQMTFVNDLLVDGNYVYDFEIYTDFYNTRDDEEEPILQLGDSIYVEQLSISESAYNFYFEMINQSFSGSPFSVPPANIPGNLTSSNGKRVLGLFTASDISVSNLVIVDSTNYTPLISSINY